MTHRKHPQNHRATRALAIATAAAAATAAITPAAHATIRLNEAMLNAPGTNSTQDYIELKGAPNEAFDLTMIMLEGDAGAAGGVGIIDHAVQLTGTTGANGLFLRHSFSVAINPTPAADTSIQTGGYGHENAAITWMLVSGFSAAVGTDLDTNDDGILDSTPWTAVLDAVGSQDGDSNGDRTYGALYGGADFNVNSSGMATPSDGKPEVIAFRDLDGAMHIASVMATTSQTQPVGGPYTVTNGGFTVQSGYLASPGNENNPVTTGARAWIGASGASFNTGANWTGGAAPSAAGQVAMFDGGGGAVMSLDADATAGVLTFDGGDHTINAGGGTLTLDTVTGNANVLGQVGTATVNAPVTLNKATNFRPGRSATLTFSNLNANGQNMTKNGIGDLILNGSGNIHAGTLNISSGGITFSDNGSHNRVFVAPSVVMSGTTSRLDLKDNKLITNTPAGVTTNGTYDGIQGMVQKAYQFGAWSGRGVALLTSMPDALTGLTTIGVATGEQVRGLGPTDTDLYAGETITGASTIAMYTYAGDANLDGTIDGGDYGIIDNFVQIPGAAGYANGDFNYDGFIDGGDYGIIDNNIQAQGAPFPTGAPAVSSAAVTAVPEPASLSVLAFGAIALFGRRRRA